MAWSDFESTLDGAFTGYQKVPESKDMAQAPGTAYHKFYTLKWIGQGMWTGHTADNWSYAHKVRIQVSYVNDSGMSDERDVNADLFVTLVIAISKLAPFAGFLSDSSFEDKDNKVSIGALEIYFGVDGLC
jgi:hypothetical protein